MGYTYSLQAILLRLGVFSTTARMAGTTALSTAGSHVLKQLKTLSGIDSVRRMFLATGVTAGQLIGTDTISSIIYNVIVSMELVDERKAAQLLAESVDEDGYISIDRLAQNIVNVTKGEAFLLIIFAIMTYYRMSQKEHDTFHSNVVGKGKVFQGIRFKGIPIFRSITKANTMILQPYDSKISVDFTRFQKNKVMGVMVLMTSVGVATWLSIDSLDLKPLTLVEQGEVEEGVINSVMDGIDPDVPRLDQDVSDVFVGRPVPILPSPDERFRALATQSDEDGVVGISGITDGINSLEDVTPNYVLDAELVSLANNMGLSPEHLLPFVGLVAKVLAKQGVQNV